MRMVESDLAELEAALGHHFRQPEWLERALREPELKKPDPTDTTLERLPQDISTAL